MNVVLEIPETVAQFVSENLPGGVEALPRRALEALAADLYRRGEMGGGTVAEMLGFKSRWETIDFLSRQGVYPSYGAKELEQDLATNERLRRS